MPGNVGGDGLRVNATPIIKSNEYEVMSSIKAVEGQPVPELEKDYLNFSSSEIRQCRFCNKSDATFNNLSHTFPAGLGNRWHISWDECDLCNSYFAKSDGHLCSALGIVLTYCGISGRNGVRSTGWVNNRHIVKHAKSGESETVSTTLLDTASGITPPEGHCINFGSDFVVVYTPNPDEKFIPRLAFKALMKIGLAIMPSDELTNFQKLSAWILSASDNEDFPFLSVSIAFDEIVNAPKAWSATLFRRKQQDTRSPYCQLVFTVGPVCIMVDLMPDSLDDNIGLQFFRTEMRQFNFDFKLKDGGSAKLNFQNFQTLDWASSSRVATPIKAMLTNSDQNGKLISITPQLRG
jgi:hypothetical protein